MLIPAIGYLILFSESSRDFMMMAAVYFNEDSEIASAQSVINLYFLYFGLLVFSLSTILFNIFCPEVIKIFVSDYDYLENEISFMTSTRAKTMQNELHDRFNFEVALDLENELSGSETDGSQKIRRSQNPNNQALWLKPNTVIIYDLLRIYYDKFNDSRVKTRATIYFAYIASLLMFSVPTVKTAWLIICNLIKN